MSSPKKPPTAIIVEDDFLIAASYGLVCEDLGIAVVDTCDTATQAIEMIMEQRPDYVLLDVRLRGEKNGVYEAEQIRERGLATKLIFVTGSQEPETLARIRKLKPDGLLSKPIPPQSLENALAD